MRKPYFFFLHLKTAGTCPALVLIDKDIRHGIDTVLHGFHKRSSPRLLRLTSAIHIITNIMMYTASLTLLMAALGSAQPWGSNNGWGQGSDGSYHEHDHDKHNASFVYSTVKGYFLQDVSTTNASTFDYVG